MVDVKLCKDCKYFQYFGDEQPAECREPGSSRPDYVLGNHIYESCQDQRKNQRHCAEVGFYWEERK